MSMLTSGNHSFVTERDRNCNNQKRLFTSNRKYCLIGNQCTYFMFSMQIIIEYLHTKTQPHNLKT